MKKTFKALLRSALIIALAAIFGFGMAGCEQPTGGGRQSSSGITPKADDFTIDPPLSKIVDGNPKAVSITPKANKSTGQITIWYEGTEGTNYTKSTTPPSTDGTYLVTFDVKAAEGFNAATGLTAGKITIDKQTDNPATPIVADFTISGLEAAANGSPKAVSITPKNGKSQGQITIWYEGISPTVYAKSKTAPSAAGSYAVTFDVATALGFNAETGLSAGTLVITGTTNPPIEPITGPNKTIDFETGWDATGYAERTVAWGGYAWTVKGVVNPDEYDHYDGNKSIRFRSNTKDTVENGIQLDSYLSGIKSISFDYASYRTHNDGKIILYYQISGGAWVKAGEVTAPGWDGNMLKAQFDINKTNVRFKIEKELSPTDFTSVNVDNIVITADNEASLNVVPSDPVVDDFSIGGLSAIADGSPKAAIIAPKPGKSTGNITIHYEGTDGTSYAKSINAPSAAGKYTVTFDVTAAAGFNAVNGLAAGTLEITTISSDLILIDFEDAAWKGTGYAKRKVEWKEYEWAVSGVVNNDGSDHVDGAQGIRFRGGNAADTVNTTTGIDNTNRVELVSYLPNGIKSISFDYASYGIHSGGEIILSYQKEGGNWVEVGRITNIPKWNESMLNKKFDVNQTGKVRFKIEKVFVGTGSISVNVDNILITY